MSTFEVTADSIPQRKCAHCRGYKKVPKVLNDAGTLMAYVDCPQCDGAGEETTE